MFFETRKNPGYKENTEETLSQHPKSNLVSEDRPLINLMKADYFLL
jgi:hypothetical protein